MAIRHHLNIFLSFLFVCFISCPNVNIDIEPKQFKVGEDLLIVCTVSDNSIEKHIAVFLKCPFNDKVSFCIKNCISVDGCTNSTCNRIAVGNQNFTCESKETLTSLTFSYRFIAISKSFINNSKQLLFTCSFRGKTASQQANVIEHIPRTNSPVDFTEHTTYMFPRFSTNTDIIETDILEKRNIILIALLIGLIISFLINIWCCVQWCIKKSKKKFRRNRAHKEPQQNYPHQDLNSNPYSNDISSQYILHDNIKRTRSHPILSNDDRSTSARNTPNFNIINHSNNGSMNSRPKFSRPSTQLLENYDTGTGSSNSLSNPMYRQMLITPFPYLSMFPISYPASFIQNTSITMDNKSQNNLDCVIEQAGLERQNSSIYQPLPRKPDEMISDKESVFS